MDMMSPYLTMSKSTMELMRSASEDSGYPSTDVIHLVGITVANPTFVTVFLYYVYFKTSYLK